MGVGRWKLGVDSVGVSEEFAGGTDRLFNLPQRGAAIEPEGVERTDLGKRGHFVAAQAAAANELVERVEAIGDWRLAIAD